MFLMFQWAFKFMVLILLYQVFLIEGACYTEDNTNTLICANITLPLNFNTSICKTCRKLVILNTIITELQPNSFINFDKFYIFHLRNLEIKQIHQNAFSGVENLLELDLSYNNISKFEINTARELVLLEHLNLSYNSLSTFKFLELPSSLKTVNVSNNQLKSVIGCNSTIGCLDVTSIDLSFNKLTILDTNLLDSFKSLQYLLLSNNNLTAISENIFFNISQLNTLDLSFNSIDNLPNQILDDQRNLQVFNISDNKLINFNSELFNNLYKLKYLNVANNFITNIDFSNINNKSLIYVNIGGNDFSCNDLFIIVEVLLNLNVTIEFGNTINNTNIYGVKCNMQQNINYDNSSTWKAVLITVAVCVSIVGFALCAVYYKRKLKRSESQITLYEI